MKFVQVLVVSFSYLLAYPFPCSFGKDVRNKLDSDLNFSSDLKREIKDVWCNGKNYTSLCRGWSVQRSCFGEKVQSEFLNKLYVYDKEILGSFVETMTCGFEMSLGDLSKVTSWGQWIHYVIVLFGFVLLLKILRRLNKIGKSVLKLVIRLDNVIRNVSAKTISSTCTV